MKMQLSTDKKSETSVCTGVLDLSQCFFKLGRLTQRILYAHWCSHCGKQYGDTSKKLKMDLPFDPAISLLGIYLKDPKTQIQKNISTPMFIAALFVITKIGKQPKFLSVDEWIKQLWGICTMEYYLDGKKRKKENFTLYDDR